MTVTFAFALRKFRDPNILSAMPVPHGPDLYAPCPLATLEKILVDVHHLFQISDDDHNNGTYEPTYESQNSSCNWN